MKSFKKALRQMFVLAAVVSMFLAMGLVGQAATLKVPAKVRIYPRGGYSRAITVQYAAPGDTIKNLKTNSKNLIAKWTSHIMSTRKGDSASMNEAGISLYAKKEGTYRVTFDVYTKANKKRASKAVWVYAKSDSPVKKCTFNGKNPYGPDGDNVQTVSSGNFRVYMNAGYKLKKVEYSVNKLVRRDNGWYTDVIYKKFTNGKKIPLNAKGNYSYYENKYENPYAPEDSYHSIDWLDSLNADTEVKITYVDKYTKMQDVTYVVLHRLAPKKTR